MEKRVCGNCVAYLTDEDENGNQTDFCHNRNSPNGFCAVRDLFAIVEKDDEACESFVHDNEGD